MHSLWQDVRYSARMLLKHPAFTLIAVITLALGIGANTAIFSLVNAVLIKPLAFAESDRLMQVYEDASAIGFPRGDVAVGNYADWKKQQTVFEDMAAVTTRSFSLTGDGEPERVLAHAVTDSFLPTLGVQPMLGRNFLAEEDQPGASKAAIISHGLWQRRYGSLESIVGKDILIDEAKYTVIGVMPPGFQFMVNTVDLWFRSRLLPQLADPDNPPTPWCASQPGVTLAQPTQKSKQSRNDRTRPSQEAEG